MGHPRFPADSLNLAMDDLIEFDRSHVWHPYAPMASGSTPLLVRSAQGTRLTLDDGREPIDAMSSWWAAIHGYRHPRLDEALHRQADTRKSVV